MADAETTLRELIEEVRRFQQERDWKRYHSPKNLAMGLAIETGELLEHFQWVSEQASRDMVGDEKAMAQIRDELADVLCYVLNLALELEVDLSEAFQEKMRKNAVKYPAETYRGKYKL